MERFPSEGFAEVPGGQVWYQVLGVGTGLPLLALHGGPGAGCDNLEVFRPLGADRPVILYDQLGCGKSDKPDDRSLWRIERYVQEIDAVRKALGLERVHLYGHSWGGWLALEYLLGKPRGVASLILGGAAASNRQFLAEIGRLRAKLSPELQAILQKYEEREEYLRPEYQNAVYQFLSPYFVHTNPPSAEIDAATERMMACFSSNTVPYDTLWGPNDMIITGSIQGWDRSDRLGEIDVPTLVLCGRYDEVAPACSETLRAGIPNAELVVFENSAHMAHWDETDQYLRALRTFLARVEQQTAWE